MGGEGWTLYSPMPTKEQNLPTFLPLKSGLGDWGVVSFDIDRSEVHIVRCRIKVGHKIEIKRKKKNTGKRLIIEWWLL